MTQNSAFKPVVETTSIPTKISTNAPFAFVQDGIDFGALTQARRRTTQVPATASSTTFAERGAMLLPLLGLAACGGGGTASPPGPPPPPPAAAFTAAADTAAITVGGPLTGTGATNVLANDTPATGATISAVIAGATAGTGGVGSAVTGTLGTLTLTTAGAVTYAPGAGATALGAGATGTDVFTYTGSIGTAASSSQLTITVTGVNDAPIAVNKAVSFGSLAAPVSLDIPVGPTGVRDPDTGDSFTITATTLPGKGEILLANGSAVAAGTVISAADFAGLKFNPDPTGTANDAVVGQTYTFTYTLRDTAGATTVGTINFGPPSINLASLSAGQGTILTAGAANSGFGSAIAGGGDVNGDGKSDVVVGAPTAGNGSIQIFFGTAGNIGAASGATISGNAAGDRFGASVAVSAGGGTASINGDARADIIVGASQEDAGGQPDSGAAYVIFGNTTLLTSVATPSTTSVLRIVGLDGNKPSYNGTNAAVDALSDTVGYSVYSPGDINGDGKADYIIGGPGLENGNVTNIAGQANNDNGAALVGYGQTTFANASLNVGDLTGASTIGTAIRGGDAATNEYFYGISAVGNFNGGTTSELAFASPFRDIAPTGVRSDNGVVYIESNFTQVGNAFNVATSDFQIVGAATGDRLGTAMAFGDVNGDGFADLIIGAPGSDLGGVDSGAVYIVYGAATNTLPTGGLIDLNAITFTAGLGTVGGLQVAVIAGGAAGQGFGASVAYLGNFDGGGATSGDFAVGTNGGSGDAYVINGGTAASVGTSSIASPDGTNVLRLDGPSATGTVVVANVGDVNGGGQADLGIGIGGANAAYVLYAKTAGQTAAALTVADTGLSYDSAGVSVDQIVSTYAGPAHSSTASLSGAADHGIAMPMFSYDTMIVSDII